MKNKQFSPFSLHRQRATGDLPDPLSFTKSHWGMPGRRRAFCFVGHYDIKIGVHQRIRSNLAFRNLLKSCFFKLGGPHAGLLPIANPVQGLPIPVPTADDRLPIVNEWGGTYMLFNSRWLLLPEIHMDPLLSCFLTFQDKPPPRRLKIKINTQKLTIFTAQRGSHKSCWLDLASDYQF